MKRTKLLNKIWAFINNSSLKIVNIFYTSYNIKLDKWNIHISQIFIFNLDFLITVVLLIIRMFKINLLPHFTVLNWIITCFTIFIDQSSRWRVTFRWKWTSSYFLCLNIRRWHDMLEIVTAYDYTDCID